MIGFLGEYVLAELRVETGELLVDLRQAFLCVRIETRAGTNKIRVVKPGDALLLRLQLRLCGRVVNSFDSFEERFVLRDLIVERGKPGGHLTLDHLKIGAVHGGAPDAIQSAHAIQALAALFECGNRVCEVRWRRVVGDLLDFGELFGHRGFERRFEERNLDTIEGRNSAVRAFPLREQRIVIGIQVHRTRMVVGFNEDRSDHRDGEKQHKSANDQVAHSLGVPICFSFGRYAVKLVSHLGLFHAKAQSEDAKPQS